KVTLTPVILGGVDLSQGAADEAWMGFELTCWLVQGIELVFPNASQRIGNLDQVAVGVVFIGGDGRCRCPLFRPTWLTFFFSFFVCPFDTTT
ncbi:MAG TPA: hypothetical protein VIE65_20190, partial [Methylobacter sp.]